MIKRALRILAVILVLGLAALLFLYNVTMMYGCVEGGGNWSWAKLECTPYQDPE